MTDKEKLEKLNKLADAMYYAAQYLTTDASRLHKAMNEYHQFIINEYHKEEPINYDKLNTMLDDALAKETKESLNERLGVSQEEHDAIVDKCLYGKEPELVDVDDLPKEEPVSNSDWLTELQEKLDNATSEQLEELWNKYNGVDEEEPVSEELEEAVNAYIGYAPEVDECSSVYGKRQAFKAGAMWQKEQINEVLLSEVLPCFMHGGEAYEVVAKLDDVLNQKK